MKHHKYHHWFYSTKLGAKIQAKQVLRFAAVNCIGEYVVVDHSVLPYTYETLRELENQGFAIESKPEYFKLFISKSQLSQIRGLGY